MVARFIGMLFVAGCTCTEQAEVVPAADAAPLQVERVGQAAPLPALPAPKADGCKRTFVVGELQGLGNRALFDQSGLGNASPVVLLRDGQPLRAHVQPDDQACDDTFIHGSLSLLAQVTADGAWSLGWSPELPLLTRERNKDVPVWWVYPGTTLRVRGEEAGPIGVFAEATAGGSWTLQAAGAQAELAAGGPGTVRGAIVAGSAPWTLEITAPPDGAALAVRGVVVGHGDAATVVIGERPPAGVRLVGGPSQAKATAKAAPPALPAGGGVKPDTKPGPQPRGRLELGALGELAPGVIVDRAGAPGCSPLLVLEDNKPVGPAHAPVKDVLANGHGAWAIQPGTALVTASDGSDPAKNGRSYTLALDADRACRGGVWVYPGDEVTVSVEGLKAGAGGATQLALTARPFAGAVAQQQLWVKLETDGQALHDAAVALGSLPGGAVLPLKPPVPPGARSALLTLSSPPDAPYLLVTLAELRGAPEGAAMEASGSAGGGAAAPIHAPEPAPQAAAVTPMGTVTFDLAGLRQDPKDVLRLVQLDATPGDSVVTPKGSGLRFEAKVEGSSRICTARFDTRSGGKGRAHVRVESLVAGAAKWQTLRFDATFFGEDRKPLLEGGKPVTHGVDVPQGAGWAWVEVPIEPPAGTAQTQLCLRFARSRGVVEIDRLEAVGQPKATP